MALPVTGAPLAPPSDTFEVATLSADTLRAGVRVSGCLTRRSSAVLTSVLRTHIAAGRRYLRVDVAAASITDPDVLDVLTAAHRDVSDLGGMLIFENVGADFVETVRGARLFVRAAD